MAVRDEITGASGDPDASFKWIHQVEKPNIKIEDLAESGEFASLDAKLAAGIAKVAQGDLGRAINTEGENGIKGDLHEGSTRLEDGVRSLQNL